MVRNGLVRGGTSLAVMALPDRDDRQSAVNTNEVDFIAGDERDAQCDGHRGDE